MSAHRLYRTAPATVRRYRPTDHTLDLDLVADMDAVTALHAAGRLSDAERDRYHDRARALLQLANFGRPPRRVRALSWAVAA